MDLMQPQYKWFLFMLVIIYSVTVFNKYLVLLGPLVSPPLNNTPNTLVQGIQIRRARRQHIERRHDHENSQPDSWVIGGGIDPGVLQEEVKC